MSSERTVYVDASGQIAGRLASRVAKLLLLGKRVIVVNSEMSLISGSRISVLTQWKEKLEISSRVNPIYGPIHPRRPDTVFKRMVRGMVPRKKPKGAVAMKNLRVYIGVPEEGKKWEFTKLNDTAASRPVPVYVTMRDLSKNLGWNE